jgi:hypothetical protein
MRLTQFGHQVPRKNSRIKIPLASNPLNLNSLPLASFSTKSGAFDPTCNVSV